MHRPRPTKRETARAAFLYEENLRAARARALTASSARSLGGTLVFSESSSTPEAAAMASTAAVNAASLAREGLLKPLILRTNCSAAARISSSLAGGSVWKSVLTFLHINVAYLSSGRIAGESFPPVYRHLFFCTQARPETGGQIRPPYLQFWFCLPR